MRYELIPAHNPGPYTGAGNNTYLIPGEERWTPKFGQVAKVDSDLRMERSESCRNGKNTPLS